MAQKHIPPNHLVFLVKKLQSEGKVSKSEAEDLVEKAISSSAADREKLLEVLDAAWPGIASDLCEAWRGPDKRAFFMWELLDLGEMDGPDEVAAVLVKALGRTSQRSYTRAGLDAGVHIARAKQLKFKRGFARVANVRLHEGIVTAKVRLDKPARFSHEDASELDAQKDNWKSKDVGLTIDLNVQTPLVKVFSTRADAKKAVLTFVGWLLDKDLEALPKEQEKLLRAISFDEDFVKQLKASLQLTVFGLEGVGADGKHRKSIEGLPLDGDTPLELDENSSDFKELDAQKLSKRGLHFRYRHPDGFVERVCVKFYFDKKHSHLNFTKQTSRPAMDSVITAVYDPLLQAESLTGT